MCVGGVPEERQGFVFGGKGTVPPGQRKRPHTTSTQPMSLHFAMSNMLRMFTDSLKHDH